MLQKFLQNYLLIVLIKFSKIFTEDLYSVQLPLRLASLNSLFPAMHHLGLVMALLSTTIFKFGIMARDFCRQKIRVEIKVGSEIVKF